MMKRVKILNWENTKRLTERNLEQKTKEKGKYLSTERKLRQTKEKGQVKERGWEEREGKDERSN